MWGVSYSGYSWSSSVNNTTGMGLDFGASWAVPCNMACRGNGFQLRCLSE
ncbi:hypothetical protein [uncultured Rikenella sp.]|nr:hypothetical protein [uncultured Rikenella sp.]